MENRILEAVQRLLKEENVCIPTETVYGLAGIATSELAVSNIFKLKKRPTNKPLSMLCHSLEQVSKYIHIDPSIKSLGEAFWPGPLTIIGEPILNSGISKVGLGGSNTLGVRIPDCRTTLNVLRNLPAPVFAPSANISSETSATTYCDVRKCFGESIFILKDDQSVSIGLESTIVDMTLNTPTITRLGAISDNEICTVLGIGISITDCTSKTVKQYATKTKLCINSDLRDVTETDAVLGFGKIRDVRCAKILNLSYTGDLHEAAKNLYKMLHTLDNAGYSRILVTPVPDTGIGKGINDRLKKASL